MAESRVQAVTSSLSRASVCTDVPGYSGVFEQLPSETVEVTPRDIRDYIRSEAARERARLHVMRAEEPLPAVLRYYSTDRLGA